MLRLKNLDFKITEHFEKLKEIFIQSMVRKDRTSFIIKEMHKEMAIFILYVDLARKNIALEVLQLFQEIFPQSLISHETWKEMVKKITYDLDYQSLKESKINKEIIPNKIRVIDKELQYLKDQVQNEEKLHPDFAYLLKQFFENLRDKMHFIKKVYSSNTTITELDKYYSENTGIIEKISNGFSGGVSSSTGAIGQAIISGIVGLATQVEFKITPENIKELAEKLLNQFQKKMIRYNGELVIRKQKIPPIYLLSTKPLQPEELVKDYQRSFILTREPPTVIWLGRETSEYQEKKLDLLSKEIFEELQSIDSSLPLQAQITDEQLHKILLLIYPIFNKEQVSETTHNYYYSNVSVEELLHYPLYFLSSKKYDWEDMLQKFKLSFVLLKEKSSLYFINEAGSAQGKSIHTPLCTRMYNELRLVSDSKSLQEQLTNWQLKKLVWALTFTNDYSPPVKSNLYNYSQMYLKKISLLASPLVTIRVWQTSLKSVGHVSLATEKMYASFWPEFTPQVKFSAIKKAVPGLWISSPKEDEYSLGETGLPKPPSYTFELLGLDVDAIESEFKKIQASDKIKWAFWDSHRCKTRRTPSRKVEKKCARTIQRKKLWLLLWHTCLLTRRRTIHGRREKLSQIRKSCGRKQGSSDDYYASRYAYREKKERHSTDRRRDPDLFSMSKTPRDFPDQIHENKLTTVQEETRLNCSSLVYHLLQVGRVSKQLFTKDERRLMEQASKKITAFHHTFLDRLTEIEKVTHQALSERDQFFAYFKNTFAIAILILDLSDNLPEHVRYYVYDSYTWSYPMKTQSQFDQDREKLVILLNRVFYNAVCQISKSVVFKKENMTITGYISQDEHTIETEKDLLTKTELLLTPARPKAICREKCRFFNIDMDRIDIEKKQETGADIKGTTRRSTRSFSTSSRLIITQTNKKPVTPPPPPRKESNTLPSLEKENNICLIL